MRSPWLWRLVLAALLFGLPLPFLVPAVHAQTPSPMAEWQYSAGQQLRNYYLWDKLPKWDDNIGLSTEFSPKYDGSAEYQTRGGPSFDIRYRDIAFLSTGEGLGVNILHEKRARAGLALTYDLGREQHSDYQLRGVGDVQPGPEIKAFGEYVWFPVTLRMDVRRSIGGYNGWVADVSLYSPIAGTDRFFVLVGPSITFADGNYMQNYFGITPEQSLNSGYPVFTATGGVKEFSFGTCTTWFFYKSWYFNASGGLARLMDDASHSPTTEENLQGVISLTIGYDMQFK